MEVHKVVKEPNEPPKLDLYVFCNEEVKDELWLCKVLFSVHSGVFDAHGNHNHAFNLNPPAL